MTAYCHLDSYFSKINPLAAKIARDINEAQSAYGQVWLTLSLTEQENILNDTIIKPEIAIHYYKSQNNDQEQQTERTTAKEIAKRSKAQQKQYLNYFDNNRKLSTYLYQSLRLQMLQQENADYYRDEHSYPFTFRTTSQINLTIPLLSTKSNLSEIDNDIPSSMHEQRIENRSSLKYNTSLSTEFKLTSLKNSQSRDSKAKQTELLLPSILHNDWNISSEPVTDEENSNTKESYEENDKLLPQSVEIPKGFDFLSNW